MELAKLLRNLSFALLMGINAGQLRADSTIKNKSLGDYTYSYTEKITRYLQLDEKDSSFSFRVVDTDSKSLIRLLDEKHDISFFKHDFSSKDSVKEVQLFDLADKFLKYFSNGGVKFNNKSQIEVYNNYLNLVKERFLNGKQTKERIGYDFNKFFAGGFKQQDTIEDLIMYSYLKYGGLVREVKTTNPEQTFQTLLDSSNIIDQIRFWFLSRDYEKNLDKLGYYFIAEPLVHGDYFEIDLTKKIKGEGLPYLKIEINMASIPDSVNAEEIRNFMNGMDNIFFKYDKKGNYLYGGFKSDK